MAAELSYRPISVDDYRRMADAGIFKDRERVELLDGMLVEMPPLGWPHAFSHGLLVEHLIYRLGERYFVSGEISIPFGDRSEPQPDIAILHRSVLRKKGKWTDLRPDEIVALIEISDSLLRRDTGPKLRIYARGAVAEYLVVDLNARRVLRYRVPVGDRYERCEIFEPPATLTLAAVPGVALDVAAFFPPG